MIIASLPRMKLAKNFSRFVQIEFQNRYFEHIFVLLSILCNKTNNYINASGNYWLMISNLFACVFYSHLAINHKLRTNIIKKNKIPYQLSSLFNYFSAKTIVNCDLKLN